MEKLNLLELLKDCPKGTKLYSPLVRECTLEHIHSELKKILISASDGTTLTFHNNGTYFQMDNSECLLFPSKDQRDWSKFQIPFEDGDVISNGAFIAIFHKVDKDHMYYHCWYNPKYNEFRAKIDFGIGYVQEYKYATEEEKEKLFQTIKVNGYKWNSETKTLKKLVEPRFKVGGRIKAICNNNQYDIKELTDTHYTLVEVKYKFKYTEPISEDKKWELVPSKFDITTLKPFDKVLVKTFHEEWKADFFSHYSKEADFPYSTVGKRSYYYCIPYEGNEHLLGTTDDCDNYYKTW